MNRSILIAGASRGLGLFLAQSFLEHNYTVFAGVRDVNAKGIVELKKKFGDLIISVALDINDTESVNKAAEAVGKYTDKLDIIINNAAIHSATSIVPLPETDLDDCLPLYNTNAIGPLRVVKAFLPFFKGENYKIVANISSEAGSIGMCWRNQEFGYCMSKTALNMGTVLLQNYLRDKNIKVAAIQPGWMKTDMGGPDALQDPYETACKVRDLILSFEGTDGTLFVDNDGNVLPW